MAIEVRREAKDETLDLDLGWSSCGLMYAQRKIYPEVKLGQICGDIEDIEGAVVPNAQVLLLASSEHAEIIEQTKSGVRGQFALQERHEGTYQLLIKSPGFQPYLRPVEVQAIRMAEGCKQPLHVRLELLL
jgi:hypothetical protein